MEPLVEFKKLHDDAIIPTRATEHSAGFDLYALEDTTIIGGDGNILVKTGIAVRLPPDTYGRVAIRSGHAVKHHFNVSAGVIDRDYVGPLGVVVFSTKVVHVVWDDDGGVPKLSPSIYTIKKGERFAQLIIEKVSYAPHIEVQKFAHEYAAAHAGFGSTGNN